MSDEDLISNLGFARLDIDRVARTGDAEVVFAEGKTPDQVVAALQELSMVHPDRAVLATRCNEDVIARCQALLPHAHVDDTARTVSIGSPPIPRGSVAVICAGTSDLPVAREAVNTIEVFGSQPDLIVDVGVSGLHRILAVQDRMNAANALVVVAGMEGALPSVVGGLVGLPIIAVPTSIGYGLNMGGLAALLSMLNSCAPGITTVNIDNGFGAGVAAARIARKAATSAS